MLDPLYVVVLGRAWAISMIDQRVNHATLEIDVHGFTKGEITAIAQPPQTLKGYSAPLITNRIRDCWWSTVTDGLITFELMAGGDYDFCEHLQLMIRSKSDGAYVYIKDTKDHLWHGQCLHISPRGDCRIKYVDLKLEKKEEQKDGRHTESEELIQVWPLSSIVI